MKEPTQTRSPTSTRQTSDQPQWFANTRWTWIMTAREQGSTLADEALEHLCKAYWHPLYVYVRRRGFTAEDAQDITQNFFCHLFERNVLVKVDRECGKFRSYLLACMNYFLTHHRQMGKAQKRGGNRQMLSLDDTWAEEKLEHADDDDDFPEMVFDRQWAQTVIGRAMAVLASEYEEKNKRDIFEQLKAYINEEGNAERYDTDARRLGIKAGAVTVAVHRLRHRYGEVIRREIARTVANAQDVESEYRYLRGILTRSFKA